MASIFMNSELYLVATGYLVLEEDNLLWFITEDSFWYFWAHNWWKTKLRNNFWACHFALDLVKQFEHSFLYLNKVKLCAATIERSDRVFTIIIFHLHLINEFLSVGVLFGYRDHIDYSTMLQSLVFFISLDIEITLIIEPCYNL